MEPSLDHLASPSSNMQDRADMLSPALTSCFPLKTLRTFRQIYPNPAAMSSTTSTSTSSSGRRMSCACKDSPWQVMARHSHGHHTLRPPLGPGAPVIAGLRKPHRYWSCHGSAPGLGVMQWSRIRRSARSWETSEFGRDLHGEMSFATHAMCSFRLVPQSRDHSQAWSLLRQIRIDQKHLRNCPATAPKSTDILSSGGIHPGHGRPQRTGPWTVGAQSNAPGAWKSVLIHDIPNSWSIIFCSPKEVELCRTM